MVLLVQMFVIGAEPSRAQAQITNKKKENTAALSTSGKNPPKLFQIANSAWSAIQNRTGKVHFPA